MYSILIDAPYRLTRNELIPALRSRGIDSRPFFYPLDTLPPYRTPVPSPVALRLSQTGLNLPSSPGLTAAQVEYICEQIRALGVKG
jgi:perosamine synthetase